MFVIWCLISGFALLQLPDTLVSIFEKLHKISKVNLQLDRTEESNAKNGDV